MITGVYTILNLINNKVYIGSSKNIEYRWKIHKRNLRKNKHHSILLQRAWNKYGEDSFKFEILELVEDKSKLITREQYYLDLYKSYLLENGYNIRPTADSNLGAKWTEKSRERKRKFWRSIKGMILKKKLIARNKSLKNRLLVGKKTKLRMQDPLLKAISGQNFKIWNRSKKAKKYRKKLAKILSILLKGRKRSFKTKKKMSTSRIAFWADPIRSKLAREKLVKRNKGLL